MSDAHRWYVAAAVGVLAIGMVAVSPEAAQGAETVHLYLKVNGANIQGESTQTSLGRENSIECVSFEQACSTAREAGSGMATGRRQYQPIIIRKRIDKSTPLLFKALAENAKVEATFKFFRTNPTGDGTTEQFFTIELKNARIASCKIFVPNCIDPASSNYPPQEDVTFVFETISWTYTNGGVTYEDSSKPGRDVAPAGDGRGVGDDAKK